MPDRERGRIGPHHSHPARTAAARDGGDGGDGRTSSLHDRQTPARVARGAKGDANRRSAHARGAPRRPDGPARTPAAAPPVLVQRPAAGEAFSRRASRPEPRRPRASLRPLEPAGGRPTSRQTARDGARDHRRREPCQPPGDGAPPRGTEEGDEHSRSQPASIANTVGPSTQQSAQPGRQWAGCVRGRQAPLPPRPPRVARYPRGGPVPMPHSCREAPAPQAAPIIVTTGPGVAGRRVTEHPFGIVRGSSSASTSIGQGTWGVLAAGRNIEEYVQNASRPARTSPQGWIMQKPGDAIPRYVTTLRVHRRTMEVYGTGYPLATGLPATACLGIIVQILPWIDRAIGRGVMGVVAEATGRRCRPRRG